ncbi:MAG: putative stage sporulation protein [Bacillales bacterium]|jgi:hypothetical protein|nr:putative stage sporulation protein [Bacillales bacterium]
MIDNNKIIVKINGKVKEVPQSKVSRVMSSEEKDELKMAVPWFLPTNIPKRVSQVNINKVISIEDFKTAKNKVKKEYKTIVKKIIVSIALSLFFGTMLGFSLLYLLTKSAPSNETVVLTEDKAAISSENLVPVKLASSDVKVIQAGVFSSKKTSQNYIQQFENRVPYGTFVSDHKFYLIVGLIDNKSQIASQIGQNYNKQGLPTYLKNITIPELNFKDSKYNQRAYNNQRLTFLETISIFTTDLESGTISKERYEEAAKSFNINKPKSDSDSYTKFILELNNFYSSVVKYDKVNNLKSEEHLLNSFVYYFDWCTSMVQK